MLKSNKIIRSISFLLLAVFSVYILPHETLAQESSDIKAFQEETRRKAQEEEKERKRIQQVYHLLEKGREERGKHNYKGAKSYGERALKLDPDSRLAKAFLDQLVIEEREYKEYQEYLKKKKEEEKRSEKEARQKKKEKKISKKKEEEEAASRQKGEKAALKKAEEEKQAKERAEAEAKRKAEVRTQEKEKAPVALEPKAEPLVKKEAKKEKAPEKEPVVKQGPEEKQKSVKPKAGEKAPEPMEGDVAELLEPGQSIIVDGDKVEYFEEEGMIVAEGNVSITYGDVILTCDRIEVNTKSRRALCEGNVVIKHPEGTLTGDRIRYDFNKKEGEVIGGELDAFPWFGRADETGKVGENEYLLRKGFVTTCDLDEPHYRITAKEIRVFPDDKIIAKNVVAYIGKVPVMWFPYYYHPIIQTRAKVQFIPGLNADWGYFLLSAWRFYIKGNSRVDVLVDYRTKKGFAAGVDLYYNASDFAMQGLGEGLFRAYFVEQNGFGTYEKSAFRDGETTEPELRKRFQWKHRIDFEPETVGMLEFNKLSDENFLKDYYYNEYEQNNRIPPNYVSVISSKPNYTFSIMANKRFNDFFTVTQRLPEFKLDVQDQRLWETPLYYRTTWSATAFERDYAFLSNPTEKTERFDTYHKFSYVASVGPVNITPYGEFRGTLYSKRKDEDSAGARMALGGGVDIFSRFHRIYDYSTDAAGLDINGLRHIMVPKINYFHRHQPTIAADKLLQMDDIDAIDKENVIKFELENKLQTKRIVGGGMKAVDLVRFLAGVDYNFRLNKRRVTFKESGEFDNLRFDLELRPYNWLFIQNKLEINPQNQSVKTGVIEFSMTPSSSFDLAFGYRYEHMTPTPRNQLTYDLRYRLNPKWALGVYQRYDLQSNSIEEQQLTVVRDLHCWEVELAYDLKGSNFVEDDFTFWLAFRIKAFPDLPIGLNRSFEKRSPGELLSQ